MNTRASKRVVGWLCVCATALSLVPATPQSIAKGKDAVAGEQKQGEDDGASGEKAKDSDKAAPAYERVSIKALTLGLTGPNVDRTIEVKDPEQIRRLASFFPGMAKGKKSDEAAGWDDLITLTFIQPDGTKHTIGSNYESWTEGKGDWPVEEGFEEYIKSLFKEEAGDTADKKEGTDK